MPEVFDQIADKYLEDNPGYSEAGITSLKPMAGVIRGMVKPFLPKSWTGLEAAEKIPWVFGDLSKLPIDAKGPHTMFLNPKSGQAAYAAAPHMHEALSNAVSMSKKAQLPDLLDEANWARIRRTVFPDYKTGLEAGKTVIIPPYVSESIPLAARHAQEASSFEQIMKMLKNKNMVPQNERTLEAGFWLPRAANWQEFR